MVEVALVVPYFNHEHAIARTIGALASQGLKCWLIDDGSSAEAVAAARRLAAQEARWLTIISHAVNRGKGEAVLTGFRAAFAAGATHALQIDADGQHDFRDIGRMVRLANAHPDAIVVGVPIFDPTIPKSRLLGRKITNFWVAVNTWSPGVQDSMCGFRVYPLASLLQLAAREHLGRRMDFDPEILVRAIWRGIPIVSCETRVTYPADGVSHFHLLRDNLRISWMHTRLFFGMLSRLPLLVARHWSSSRP